MLFVSVVFLWKNSSSLFRCNHNYMSDRKILQMIPQVMPQVMPQVIPQVIPQVMSQVMSHMGSHKTLSVFATSAEEINSCVYKLWHLLMSYIIISITTDCASVTQLDAQIVVQSYYLHSTNLECKSIYWAEECKNGNVMSKLICVKCIVWSTKITLKRLNTAYSNSLRWGFSLNRRSSLELN